VKLYNNSGVLVAEKQANVNSVVEFSGLAPGTYWYQVYNVRVTPWGKQFWGEKTGITIVGGQTTYDTHTHNTPFLPETKVYINNTNEFLPLGGYHSLQPGTVLRVEVKMTNPSYAGAQVITEGYARLYLDHDGVEPYDSILTSSKVSFAIGETRTMMLYPVVPVAKGDYFLSAGAFASSTRYTTSLTDAGNWEGPAFTVGTGLVAHYPFSGNALDSSGNHHDGNVHGATLATDRFGVPNSAYAFNGIDNDIEVPHNNALNPRAAITFAGWFQTNSTSRVGNILSKGSDVAAGFYVARLHPAPINLGLGIMFTQDVATSLPTSVNPSSVVPSVGQWYFFAVTYDGQRLCGYLDGVVKDSLSVVKTLGSNEGPLSIGRHPLPGYDYWFDGKIDDIRLYNRALSSSEIVDLYHEGGYPVVGTPPWKFANTGTSHTVVVPLNANPNIAGTALVSGDYIGVFYDSSGTLACAGYEKWTGTASIAVSAFGDDPTSAAKDGFTADEVFRWKIWRQSDSHAYVAKATYVAVGGLGGMVSDTNKYNTNGISAITALTGSLTSIPTAEKPTQYSLMQNYPNPFNPSTTITFGIPERARVHLMVYNTLGEQVAELVNDELEAGYHSVRFDASGLSSGVYFYRMQSEKFTQTLKLMTLR
jgi:hypothetical protein